MNELNEQLKAQRSQREIQESISTLQLTLEAVKKAQGENYPQHAKEALIKSVMNIAWSAIPEYVSALDLGNGISVERAKEDIDKIPERSREFWDLERIDQHGSYLSTRIGKNWQPIFPATE